VKQLNFVLGDLFILAWRIMWLC